eukprot:TRINITY_DN9636_c0_g1_i7.p2 TRINITY_DN9636_c0_g1~~TRINITY_DN9636_c0_g1_i7.p2  ORF type:complete len:190 (-),score=-4.81 TRINITY_DN9636_c0_g1_i7:401-970(-)
MINVTAKLKTYKSSIICYLQLLPSTQNIKTQPQLFCKKPTSHNINQKQSYTIIHTYQNLITKNLTVINSQTPIVRLSYNYGCAMATNKAIYHHFQFSALNLIQKQETILSKSQKICLNTQNSVQFSIISILDEKFGLWASIIKKKQKQKIFVDIMLQCGNFSSSRLEWAEIRALKQTEAINPAKILLKI